MSLGEFEVISRYFQREYKRTTGGAVEPQLELGIGDDAAVLAGIGDNRIAISVDTLVESVHFPEGANPSLLAQRALRVNLSDMAAMGADPRWFTLALTLPNVSESWLSDFSRGLHEDAAAYGCALIGGDTTKGPLNIGIQVMGLVSPSQSPLTRSAAKAGDYLVVTGTLGDAGAALSFDLNACFSEQGREEPSMNLQRHFLARYWLPTPRVDFARQGIHLINAACDISDGLLADAGHLCEQSGLSASVEITKIPVSEQLLQFSDNAQRLAATAGDDYELCMAVAPSNLDDLRLLSEDLDVPISVVGRFSESTDALSTQVRLIDDDGADITGHVSGYRHF